jgi:hypothetical protein
VLQGSVVIAINADTGELEEIPSPVHVPARTLQHLAAARTERLQPVRLAIGDIGLEPIL